MGRRMFRVVGTGTLTLLLVTSFQNCGKSFQSSRETLLSSGNAQCRVQLKNEITRAKLPAAEIRCGDFNNYACERRVFSPDVENLTHQLRECLPGEVTCVDVDVRQFNTAGARNPASESEFRPGGDYNREEIRCYHRLQVKGLIVFDGEGDTLAEALGGAVKACEAAEEGA